MVLLPSLVYSEDKLFASLLMKLLEKVLKKITFVGLALLMLLLPWHDTLVTVLLDGFDLRSIAGLDTVIPFYKEFLLLLLGCIAFFFVVRDKLWRKQKWILWIIGFVIVMMLVSLLQSDFSLANFIVGARYEFGFLVALFVGGVLLPYLEDRERSFLVKLAIGNLFVVLLWAFLWQLIGYENLVHLGFRNDWSTSYLEQAPAFCQKEAGTEFCRMQGAFAGPNRFAAYLLAIFPLLWNKFKKNKGARLLRIPMLIALILTLSSGAYLALVFGGLVLIFVGKKWNQKVAWYSYVVVGILLIVVSYVYWPQLVETSLHFRYLDEGLRHFWLNPFGSGVWIAGPASIPLGAKFVPESWFVQVLVNGGLFGFTIFVGMLWALFKRHMVTRKLGSRGVFFIGFLYLILHNLFLHTFEVPAAFWVLALLFGLAEVDLLNNTEEID